MHNIAKNIKMIRREKGWTQQQLADFLFVTRQTVSNWENGRALPDLETIEQISEKLGITSEYLLYGKLTEAPYRKLNALTVTIVMSVLMFLFLLIEKFSYIALNRISKYAGYYIVDSGMGYGEWNIGIMISFFAILWMFVLLVNWVVADSDSVSAKFIKGCTNILLSYILLYSTYSMMANCMYTFRRYENVVVKAHQRFEMTDSTYGLILYRHGSLDFYTNRYTNKIAYIDNDDPQTDEFMEYLINSQALEVSRFPADGDFAKNLMWQYGIETVPAVIIVAQGNMEILEGYEEISSKLESKIHNYKMHNIFFN